MIGQELSESNACGYCVRHQHLRRLIQWWEKQKATTSKRSVSGGSSSQR